MPGLAAYSPHPGWRFATGIAISIFLHVLMLAVLRPPAPTKSAPSVWSTPVTVRLLPRPPEPMALPEPEPKSEPGKRVVVPKAPRPHRAAPEAVYAPTPDRTREAREEAPAETARPAEEVAAAEGAPRFDPDAARAAARNIASTLDEPKSDAPNAQVNRGPRYRATKEQKLAREIKQSARPNCKDGIPGGLLAPLYLMMDKKDHGCKW